MDLIFPASSLYYYSPCVFSAPVYLALSLNWTFTLHGNTRPDSLPHISCYLEVTSCWGPSLNSQVLVRCFGTFPDAITSFASSFPSQQLSPCGGLVCSPVCIPHWTVNSLRYQKPLTLFISVILVPHTCPAHSRFPITIC